MRSHDRMYHVVDPIISIQHSISHHHRHQYVNASKHQYDQQQQQQQQATQQQQQQQHRTIKLLVLGAASAGKTSLLRRYFYQQFEYVRMSTVGSDVYVGNVPINKNHNNSNNDNSDDQQQPFVSTTTTTAVDDTNNHHNATKATTTTINTTRYVKVQMWDTPGKENFVLPSHHSNHRIPTKSQNSSNNNSNISHSFVQYADAIMLVYDMTSSTSFTRLLHWYSILMNVFMKTQTLIPILIVANKVDLYHMNHTYYQNTIVNQNQNTRGRYNETQLHQQPSRNIVTQRDVLGLHGVEYYGKHFQYEYQISPITNDDHDDEQNNYRNGTMKKTIGTDTTTNNPIQHRTQQRHRSSSISSNDGHMDHTHKRRMEISSYLVNRDNWTTDGSYLESLVQSEDGSHPDRDMVGLWCKRNRLPMMEVSAATNENVTLAIETLVQLAVQHIEQNNMNKNTSTSTTTMINHNDNVPSKPNIQVPRINKELDFHHRYSNRDDSCFCLPSIRNCMVKR